MVAKYVCRQRALKVFNDFESHLSQLSAFSHFVVVLVVVVVVVVVDGDFTGVVVVVVASFVP